MPTDAQTVAEARAAFEANVWPCLDLRCSHAVGADCLVAACDLADALIKAGELAVLEEATRDQDGVCRACGYPSTCKPWCPAGQTHVRIEAGQFTGREGRKEGD